jgi:hypothetical protein
MRIVWFSRHEPIPSQIAELKRLFGDDIEIIQDPKPFSSAEEIVERFRTMEGDEMVVVAPLSVMGRLCDLGIKPLWAEMEQVPVEEAEVIANGRGYRFVRFRRVKRLSLEFEEV